MANAATRPAHTNADPSRATLRVTPPADPGTAPPWPPTPLPWPVGAPSVTADALLGDTDRIRLARYFAARHAAVGLDPDDYAGHSLRSGFMTSAALAKASLFKMMGVSRHKDPKTVMIYVRRSAEFQDHAGEGLL